MEGKEMSEIYEELRLAVIDGDEDIASELSQKIVDEGINPVDAVQLGLIKGIEVVGEGWKAG
jgi:trimethylamine corrinoid protein